MMTLPAMPRTARAVADFKTHVSTILLLKKKAKANVRKTTQKPHTFLTTFNTTKRGKKSWIKICVNTGRLDSKNAKKNRNGNNSKNAKYSHR
jgi:hypothetical protein